MPGSTVDELIVRIAGDDEDLKKTLDDSVKSLNNWSASAAAAGTKAFKALSTVSAGAVVAGSALVKSGLDSADAQAKLAIQLATTSEQIAILERSSELAGVSQSTLEGASKALTVRLSQAATGTGTAVAALDSLGLSAEQLIQLPLADRIALINKSINENADANDRASLAAQFFGEDAGLAVSKLSPETISQATNEVHKYRAALSEVDAAKIEMANDAISQSGLIYKSITQRLAAEFSPLLIAISNELGDAASESDAFANIAKDAFDVVIGAAGLLADSFRGINLSIKLGEYAFDSLKVVGISVVYDLLKAFDKLSSGAATELNKIIDAANSLPGVDIDKLIVGESSTLKELSASLKGAQKELDITSKEFYDLANEEMPSEKLKKWSEDVSNAADKAAESIVKSKEALNKVPTTPLIGGLTPAELKEQKKILSDLLGTTIESLRTEQEVIDDAYNERSKTLQASLEQGLITQQDYNEQQQRSEQEHQNKIKALRSQSDEEQQKKMLESRLENTLGYLQTEQEAVNEAYSLRSETLIASLEQGLLTQEEYNLQAQLNEQDHQDKLTAIQQSGNQARFQLAGQFFGNLATLMQTENKTLFEIGKVAAIAQATINGIEATISSYRFGAQLGGPALGAAFAATAAVATGVQIAKLASTTYGSRGGASPGTPGSVTPSITQDANTGAGGGRGGTLTVQGLNPSSLFTGEAVSQIAEELLEYQRNGGNVVLQG